MPSSPTLLAVFAHPDDESFCAGGGLALMAVRGVSVVVLSLTRGEGGKVSPDLLESDPFGRAGVADVAALRTREMERACEALGIEPPRWSVFHDSGFHQPTAFPNRLVAADPLKVAGEILAVIADVKPDALLGFDPHGYYGHPDHIAAHRALGAVWGMSGHLPDPPARLFYPLPSPMMIERFNRAGFGNLESERFAAGPRDAAVTVDATPVLRQKRAAIAAHRSQSAPGSGIDRLLPELRQSGAPRILTEEIYALAATRSAVPRYPLRDFFDGLKSG